MPSFTSEEESPWEVSLPTSDTQLARLAAIETHTHRLIHREEEEQEEEEEKENEEKGSSSYAPSHPFGGKSEVVSVGGGWMDEL